MVSITDPVSGSRGTVLVTGGAGYVGSHTCKALARAGYLPDNLTNGHEWAVKWGPLEHGEILDRRHLDKIIARVRSARSNSFCSVCLCGESINVPDKYYRNNIVGTLNLLEAMLANGIEKIIFSSSCATYGVPVQLPITEEAVQQPINPYGASKLMVERILRDFGFAYGLRWTVLRYFNAGGADPDGEIGELHNPETHLIRLVLDAASGQRPHVTIFGTDYETDDGTCRRDYIQVTDLAHAHVLPLRALLQGACSSAYNLGKRTRILGSGSD